MCFALDHSCVERLRIQAGWELTQDGLHSGVKTQSVSRELFDVHGASALGDGPRAEETAPASGPESAGPAQCGPGTRVRKPPGQRAQAAALSDMNALPLRGGRGRQEGGLSVGAGDHVYSGSFSSKMVQSQ